VSPPIELKGEENSELKKLKKKKETSGLRSEQNRMAGENIGWVRVTFLSRNKTKENEEKVVR
jgi:hypothetical protein